MTFGWLMVATTVVLTSLGQIIVKWQVNKATAPSGNLFDYFLWGLKLAVTPWILLVFILGAGAAFAWFFAMTRLPLSFAYPFVGLTFPTVAIAASTIFGESLNFWHLSGILVMVVGLAMIASAGSAGG